MASEAIETANLSESTQVRAERYQQLAATLREWMNEDDDYDSEVWPVLERSLSDDRISFRDPDATHP